MLLLKLRFPFQALAAVTVAALSASCAPPPPAGTAVDRGASLQSAALAGANLTGSGGWQCPSSPNVTLKNNICGTGYCYDGEGDFTVCAQAGNTNTFEISGSTPSRTICVYPMNVGQSSSLEIVDIPKCFAVTGSAISASFSPKAAINYMIIVDESYTDQMDACLSGPSPCPSHSEGFVQ